MKLKLAERWVDGRLKARLPTGWIDPERLLVKQAGEWSVVDGLEMVRLNQIADIITDTSGWTYDTNRGWYRDVYDWDKQHHVKFSNEFLAKIRKVSVLVTGYYNTPSDCMGVSSCHVLLSNGTNLTMGTSDSWDLASSGQGINKGDLGTENMRTRNVVGERYTCTVPEGLVVTAIYLSSGGYYYSPTGRYYPISLRGMKDFEFTLQH